MNPQLLYWTGMLGLAVFALSGVLAAGRKGLDWFGVMVVAGITAIGGGTLRDLLLNRHPLLWLTDANYILVIVGTCLLALIVLWAIPDLSKRRSSKAFYRTFLLSDALGLALFSLQGAGIAEAAHLPWASIIVLGTLTGVGGGMLRDVLTNEIPLILHKDIYATAAILGIVTYLILPKLGLSHEFAFACGMGSVVVLRVSTIVWQLKMPTFHWHSSQD